MYCPHCGEENNDGAKFCAQCGKPLKGETKTPDQDPAPQVVIVRENRNWLNLILSVLLVLALLCVGSAYYISSAEAVSASPVELIANPSLFLETARAVVADLFQSVPGLVDTQDPGDDGGDEREPVSCEAYVGGLALSQASLNALTANAGDGPDTIVFEGLAGNPPEGFSAKIQINTNAGWADTGDCTVQADGSLECLGPQALLQYVPELDVTNLDRLVLIPYEDELRCIPQVFKLENQAVVRQADDCPQLAGDIIGFPDENWVDMLLANNPGMTLAELGDTASITFNTGLDFSDDELAGADFGLVIYGNEAVYQNGEVITCEHDPETDDDVTCPGAFNIVQDFELPQVAAFWYASDNCSDGVSWGARDGVITVQDPGDQTDIADICAETFYQPPEFTVLGWTNSTLSVDVFAPVLSAWPNEVLTPYDQWISGTGIDADGDEFGQLESSMLLQLNSEAMGTCDVGARHFSNSNLAPGANWTDQLPGIEMRCYIDLARPVNDWELATLSLYGFGCNQPVATQARLSIPPKQAAPALDPVQVDQDTDEDDGLDANGCYQGDEYSYDEGVCCAPEDFYDDGVYDSCNTPFYDPYP